jgi:hypothetical protein
MFITSSQPASSISATGTSTGPTTPAFVDRAIQPSEPGECSFYQGLDVCTLSHVGLEEKGFAAECLDLAHNRLAFVLAPSGNHYFRSFAGELECRGCSDSGAASGNNHYFPVKRFH